MKQILYLILATMLMTSCATTIGIGDDDIYVSTNSSIYYDDIRWAGYEIVWINDWPYWYGNSQIIPYHHNHTLIVNNNYNIVRRPYKPILHNNRFHPRHQSNEYHKNRTHYIEHNRQQNHVHQNLHNNHAKQNSHIRNNHQNNQHSQHHNRTRGGRR